MDVAKLPLDVPSKEGRNAIRENLEKSRKDFEKVPREALAAGILSLDAEALRKRTLSLAFLIHANLTGAEANNSNASDSFKWLLRFIELCDESEIRFSDEALEVISRTITNVVVERGRHACAEVAGALLIALRKRLSGNWSELCSIHADVVQVCLVAKLYPIAAQIAEIPTISVSDRGDGTPLSKALPFDLIRYFYYSGIALCAVRRFPEAFHAFSQCLSFPSRGYGATHEEAYKKFVLVSLIVKGKRQPLPKYTPQVVTKAVTPEKQSAEKTVQISVAVQRYHSIADAFEKKDDFSSLQEFLKQPLIVEQLTADDNYGLLSHVLDAYWKKHIVELTGTYVTLSIQDIAAEMSTPVDRTEALLLNMIRNREVNARLDQRTGMVRFLSESEDVEEQALAASKIEAELVRVGEFANELRALDRRLSTSKDYIRKLTLRSDLRSAFQRGYDSGDVTMADM